MKVLLPSFNFIGGKNMTKNEVGTKIPEYIESMAKKMGLNLKYIYEDGDCSDKYPASNPGGGRKSTRFRNMSSANAHKFKIADNWVYFKSPTYANYPTNPQEEISIQLSSEDITIALNMPPELQFDSNWHLFYGITQARKSALVGSSRKQESVSKPKSEKFLTFFMLVNLDSWQQPICLRISIRQEKNTLSDHLFKKTSLNNKDLWVKPKEVNFNPNHLHLTSSLNKDDMNDSIFFFEVDIMGLAKRSFKGNTFKEISFLNISSKEGWSEFDAYLFLPTARRCIFIEAKLDSDISDTVTLNGKDIKISQITRAMESAYLFTHHLGSYFNGWDYDYLFICPRDKYENSQMDYSQLIPQIQKPDSDVFRNEYNNLELDSSSTKQDLFDNFLSTCHKHIHVIFWDELLTIIHENIPNFLSNYMNNLKSNKSLYDIAEKRFELATIQL